MFYIDQEKIVLVVSLDAVGDRHDTLRGVKCFERAMKTIKKVKHIYRNISIVASLTVSKLSHKLVWCKSS